MSNSKAGAKNTMFGKKHTEETRAKMSSFNKGIKRSEEIRAKMSIAKARQNNPMFGKTQSEETRTKIRETKNISIEVFNLNTEEIKIYSSGRDASISLGCSPATITGYAKTGMLYKGIYKIRKLI